jgi:hypothetical protein
LAPDFARNLRIFVIRVANAGRDKVDAGAFLGN